MTETDIRPRPRKRPRFRPVRVRSVGRLAPWLVSVELEGELSDFEVPDPTQHIKVLVPGAGEHSVAMPTLGEDGIEWPSGAPRPAMRTYTPRRFDPEAATLEVQFVIHGDGPASEWAERAEVGDRLAVAGPGGRLSLEIGPGPWVVAGDESAVPAIGTLLEALPDDAEVQVFVESEHPGEAAGLDGHTHRAEVDWRQRTDGDPGATIFDRVVASSIDPETNVWVAGEAISVRRVRKALMEAGRPTPKSMVTRGYWRLGETNHPDHDYGDD